MSTSPLDRAHHAATQAAARLQATHRQATQLQAAHKATALANARREQAGHDAQPGDQAAHYKGCLFRTAPAAPRTRSTLTLRPRARKPQAGFTWDREEDDDDTESETAHLGARHGSSGAGWVFAQGEPAPPPPPPEPQGGDQGSNHEDGDDADRDHDDAADREDDDAGDSMSEEPGTRASHAGTSRRHTALQAVHAVTGVQALRQRPARAQEPPLTERLSRPWAVLAWRQGGREGLMRALTQRLLRVAWSTAATSDSHRLSADLAAAHAVWLRYAVAVANEAPSQSAPAAIKALLLEARATLPPGPPPCQPLGETLCCLLWPLLHQFHAPLHAAQQHQRLVRLTFITRIGAPSPRTRSAARPAPHRSPP